MCFMQYFMYLPATRFTLDVVNCVPSDPPDERGYTYMAATAERCWEPGGTHLTLLPFAILIFIAYIVGYPLAVAYVLIKHREDCKEDQLLRAMRVGESRRTNPNLYEFRYVHIPWCPRSVEAVAKAVGGPATLRRSA